jgi:hypothetical protein
LRFTLECPIAHLHSECVPDSPRHLRHNMAKISTELDNANTASEPTSRSKKVKKTYSKRGKLHGPGKINKESEGDDMEGSGADNNEEEAEKSSGILAGGDQRDHDNDRNRSSLELGQHGDEEKVTEETDTVAAADKSEYEVEEEKGEAPLTNGGTSSTSAATTTGAASTANGTCVDTSQAANISADQQPSPSLPKLKRKRGRPSGSSKKSTHFSKVYPPSPSSSCAPM